MSTIQTNAVRTYHDKKKQQRPLSIPIVQAVNFEAESSVQLGEDFRNGTGFVYQRFGHPTIKAAGEKIELLEGSGVGLVFSSGMGAFATSLMALIERGNTHVIAQRQIFALTFTFLDSALRS